ncbi:MAG: N-substituted formamide deformylase precursor [Candidatus Heimdallarchaeota archaeon LC_3]|nr:MAG: N-substituted formamide deformylase precursor [Candidatus Heimdallarchaeota archaeon LC_3]
MKSAILADKIYSLDKPNELFEALIIENETILDLTSKNHVLSNKSEFQEIVEYNGTIIPGFIDSHLHAIGIGSRLEQIELKGIKSIREMLTKVEEKVSSTDEGEWVIGVGWDQELFNEKRYPTKWDLDYISPNHPIILARACHHIGVLNSKALDLIKINKTTPDPEGGSIDKENGDPTGILRENAWSEAVRKVPEPTKEDQSRWLQNAQDYLNSVGITTIHTLDSSKYDIYQSIKDTLKVRVYFTPNYEDLDELLKNNPKAKTGNGDDYFRWGRVKLYSDGSLGAQTAAMREPYENSNSTGILIYSKEELHKRIKDIDEKGWQLETHAIGDKGAELTINGYEKYLNREKRPILTHCQILGDDLIQKMSDLGIIASIQPIFIESDMNWAEKFVGKKRMKYSYAWKTLMERGVWCSGGSDAPIEKPDPILSLHATVNRQKMDKIPEGGWYPEERLSIWEALRLFTYYAAYAEFQEHRKGLLKPGYLADFVLLDKDPFTISPEEILNLKVLGTFVGGKRVFSC